MSSTAYAVRFFARPAPQGPGRVILIRGTPMPNEPAIKRTIAFVDGQNLFHATKDAFGYTVPNFDLLKLCNAITKQEGWNLQKIQFYTGTPDQGADPTWHYFWRNKLGAMGRQGIHVYTRQLAYSPEIMILPNGSQKSILVPREKGIDIRLALDVIRSTLRGDLDVALILSQDQDLTEVADEIRDISIQQNRWLKIASAFPSSPAYRNKKGIDRTDWVPFDKKFYDAYIDPKRYFPKPKKK
jgi:uncharacterized LabA/DUF88 family protein